MAYRYVFSKDQPRYLNFPLQLKWFGYMANTFAKYQNKKARDGVFFGLILRSYGGKMYWNDVTNQERYEIHPPCFSAAPAGTISSIEASCPWDEVYLGYSEDLLPDFQKLGINIDGRCYPLKISPVQQKCIDELRELSCNLDEPGMVDRLDMAAFRLIMECYLPSAQSVSSLSEQQVLHKIADHLIAHSCEKIKFSQIVKAYGLSHRDFYRKWSRIFNLSPAQFVMKHRLEQACNLLKFSNKRINEIAFECGFSSSITFCRCFRKNYGITPAEFRQKEEHALV